MALERTLFRAIAFSACWFWAAALSATSAAPPPIFSEIAPEAGLSYVHGYRDVDGELLPIESLSALENLAGGVAAGDFDGDGWVDLYAASGGPGPNLLFRNRGDGRFDEVAASAGLGLAGIELSGPTFADINGDGHLDVVAGALNAPPPVLLGSVDGVFADATSGAGLMLTTSRAINVAFGDADQDGDLDLALAQWGARGDAQHPVQHLWFNDGHGHFEPHDAASGVVIRSQLFGGLPVYWSFTPNFTDIDGDGRADILFASDFGTSQVLRNVGGGHFEDTTTHRHK